jgi:hypothetical protein
MIGRGRAWEIVRHEVADLLRRCTSTVALERRAAITGLGTIVRRALPGSAEYEAVVAAVVRAVDDPGPKVRVRFNLPVRCAALIGLRPVHAVDTDVLDVRETGLADADASVQGAAMAKRALAMRTPQLAAAVTELALHGLDE